MKHNSSFSFLIPGILLLSVSISYAGNFKAASSDSKTKIVNLSTIGAESEIIDLPQPAVPVTRQEEPVKKPQMQKTEELAHIHEFHKERVKKLKRHHKKFWILSKILLLISHLLLLVCAYMHLVHP